MRHTRDIAAAHVAPSLLVICQDSKVVPGEAEAFASKVHGLVSKNLI